MKKKNLFSALAIALCVSLASCGNTETNNPTPTEAVTTAPTTEATPEPTKEVTNTPEAAPTEEATPSLDEEPTAEATPDVTAEPTEEITPEVTEEPTPEPTEEVTPEPTKEPTKAPTKAPTPTNEPTKAPTAEKGEYRVNVVVYAGNDISFVYDKVIKDGEMFPGWTSKGVYNDYKEITLPSCKIGNGTKDEMKSYCWQLNTYTDSATGEDRIDFVLKLTPLVTPTPKPTEVPPTTKGVVFENVPVGDNVTMTLYENGTLTVDGTGPTWEYTYEAVTKNRTMEYYLASHGHCNKVKKIVFGEGITRIGEQLFNEQAPFCKEIVFSSTITSIGQYAFYAVGSETQRFNNYDASKIEDKVKINFATTKIKFIDFLSFAYIPVEEYIELPHTLEELNEYAFYATTPWNVNTTLVIPASVKRIPNYVGPFDTDGTGGGIVFHLIIIKGKSSIDDFEDAKGLTENTYSVLEENLDFENPDKGFIPAINGLVFEEATTRYLANAPGAGIIRFEP